MNRIKVFILIVTALCCGPRAAAQLMNAPAAADTTLTISLITCDAGSDIYTLEGHTGLRIKKGELDVMVNWGLFDFAAPNFVYRFVKGETDYNAGAFPSGLFIQVYDDEKRRVTERVLNLSSEQAQRVLDLVEQNLRPENSVYRYNYVKDNCALRPLRIIEKAVGDSIILGPGPAALPQPLTFRKVMEYYHRNYPWYQFGIDICLGSGIDYEIANPELAFAPVALDVMLAEAQVAGPQGLMPLVSETRILVDVPEGSAVMGATPWLLTPIAVFSLLLLITLLLTVRDIRRRKLTAWFDCVFYAFLGLIGCLLTFLIFVSIHEATSPNYLYLWLNPLCLLLAGWAFSKPGNRTAFILQCINLLGIAAYVVVIAAGVQDFNLAFIPILLADLCRCMARLYLRK